MLASRLVPDDRVAVQSLSDLTRAAVDVEAELSRPWALFWVARPSLSEDPSAFLVAWAVADELHLIHVATHPAERRRGAARALMSALVDHAKEQRSRLVLLEVRRSNRPAIRLYRAFGFTAMGVRRAYYSDGEDAIEMMLTLDPKTGHVTPGHDEVTLADA
jgi:ribosomal-protein-alanine N-acetyltransferase